MRPAKTKQESAQRSAPKERQRNLGTPERARLIPASQGRNPAFTSCFRMSALILFGFVEKPSATGAQPSWLWGKRASCPLSRGKRQARCLSAPQAGSLCPGLLTCFSTEPLEVYVPIERRRVYRRGETAPVEMTSSAFAFVKRRYRFAQVTRKCSLQI